MMGAASDPGSDADAQAVFVIEISAMPDGTFSVELESGQQEEAEESGGGDGSEDDSGAQTAKSWSDAMEIANQLYEQASGDDGASKAAGFNSVFSGSAGQ